MYYLYEDRQDVIDSMRKFCEQKIAFNSKLIAEHKPRSQIRIAALGERDAYSTVLAMLTNYKLKSDEAAPTE